MLNYARVASACLYVRTCQRVWKQQKYCNYTRLPSSKFILLFVNSTTSQKPHQNRIFLGFLAKIWNSAYFHPKSVKIQFFVTLTSLKRQCDIKWRATGIFWYQWKVFFGLHFFDQIYPWKVMYTWSELHYFESTWFFSDFHTI